MRWTQPLRLILLLTILGIGFAASPSAPLAPINTVDAQSQCGIVDSPDDLDFPLDTLEFNLIQPFGRVSGRFDGKLHAGEDWIANRRSDTLGKPVHAIGPGWVTYSDPLGWGQDKGVVIVQHTMNDGSVYFSLYGHMEELNGIEFVERGDCVEKGDVLGAIGSPRPAPHLHFEIRNFLSNAPGPGYWDVDPTLRGWVNPHQFIINWQAWMSESHLWHRPMEDATGPHLPNIMRADGVVLMLDGNLLRAYNNEGGRLWEYRLADSIDPIGFYEVDDQNMMIASRDGRLQLWNQYGGYISQWDSGLGELAQSPIEFGDILLLRTPEDYLNVFGINRNLLGRYADIPEITAWAMSGSTLAMITQEPELILMDATGAIFDRQTIKPSSDIIAMPGDSGFYLRDRGDLYQLDLEGSRRSIAEDLSVNRSDRQMILSSDGNLIFWGINGRSRLMALNPATGEILWETDIDDISPSILRAELVQANVCTLILGDRRGRLFTFDLEDGALGGQLTLYGSNLNGVWLSGYPTDSTLRVHIANQLLGLDTRILAGRPCSGAGDISGEDAG